MDFQLLDKEITESKLYYQTSRYKRFDGRDIADMLYLNMICLLILHNEDQSFAEDYAKRTSQFGTYALFRTHATDMYMLSYQILHPNNDYTNMKDPVDSKEFLSNLKYDSKANIRILRQIYGNKIERSRLSSYMFSLERQLKINNKRYLVWRREALMWRSLFQSSKERMIKLLIVELKRIGAGGAIKSDLAKKIKELAI